MLVAFLEESLANEPETPTLTPELKRIANALERIAASLEKLAPVSPTAPLQNGTVKTETKVVTTQQNITNPPKNGAISPATKVATTQQNPAAKPAPILAEPIVLRQYLEKHNITLDKSKTETDPKLERLAVYLGHNYAACEELYNLLKRNLNAPQEAFSYSLKEIVPAHKKIIRQFCHLLKVAGLLEEYSYHGSPDFKVQIKASGTEKKFINGAWLESSVRHEIVRIVEPYGENSKQQFKIWSNVEITCKDGAKRELDVLFALGKKVYCVEAKLKPDKEELEEWVKRVKPLGLENKFLLVVAADKSIEECQKLRQTLGNVAITGLDNLEQTLLELVKTK